MRRLAAKNPRVAEVRTLARQKRARDESRRFVVEGPKLIAEAFAAGLTIHGVFIDSEDGWELSGIDDIVAAAESASADLFELDAGVIARVAPSTSPQPVIAVAARPTAEFDDVVTSASLVLVAVDLNDPGNLGTLIRSAVASGADAVVCLGACADVWSPKTVRSSAGAAFHVPCLTDRDAPGGLGRIGEAGLHRLGLDGTAGTTIDECDLTAPTAVVVGSEAHGLGVDLDGSIDKRVAIPMHGPTESLNAAMAGTVALYEGLRQRRRSNLHGR